MHEIERILEPDQYGDSRKVYLVRGLVNLAALEARRSDSDSSCGERCRHRVPLCTWRCSVKEDNLLMTEAAVMKKVKCLKVKDLTRDILVKTVNLEGSLACAELS